MENKIKNLLDEHWLLGLFISLFAILQLSFYLEVFHWLVGAIVIFALGAFLTWRIKEARFETYLKSLISETQSGYLNEAFIAVKSLSIPEIDGYTFIPSYQETHSVFRHKIFLRRTMNKYPWEGKVLTFQFGEDVSDFKFHIERGSLEDENHKHFVVPTPRIKTKNGKNQNRYSWEWIYKNSESLRRYFAETFSKNPEKAYKYLLYAESCFQTRTGTKSSWVQFAEYQKCSVCKKTMHQIAQISTHEFGYRDFTIYLLGCTEHSTDTKFVWQCT